MHGVGDLRVETVPSPGSPSSGKARLRVSAAGICGSDLHNFATAQWITRTPVTPGHELTGIVEEVASDVTELRVGDRVVADSRYWCGECEACTTGRRHLCERLGFVGEVCDGGFAEEVTLPARLLHKVDPSLEARIAVMAEPLAVALHAVRRLRPGPGCPVLVVGCGTIGGFASLVLSRTHDGPVLACDRNADRAALVRDVTGARLVQLDRTGMRAASGGLPVFHAIEATGSVAALRAAMDCVDRGATLALVGIFHERLDLDPNWLVEREASLVGCHVFDDELSDAVELLRSLSPQLAKLTDGEVDIESIPAAYARLAAGASQGLKTAVLPGHRSGPVV